MLDALPDVQREGKVCGSSPGRGGPRCYPYERLPGPTAPSPGSEETTQVLWMCPPASVRVVSGMPEACSHLLPYEQAGGLPREAQKCSILLSE